MGDFTLRLLELGLYPSQTLRHRGSGAFEYRLAKLGGVFSPKLVYHLRNLAILSYPLNIPKPCRHAGALQRVKSV